VRRKLDLFVHPLRFVLQNVLLDHSFLDQQKHETVFALLDQRVFTLEYEYDDVVYQGPEEFKAYDEQWQIPAQPVSFKSIQFNVVGCKHILSVEVVQEILQDRRAKVKLEGGGAVDIVENEFVVKYPNGNKQHARACQLVHDENVLIVLTPAARVELVVEPEVAHDNEDEHDVALVEQLVVPVLQSLVNQSVREQENECCDYADFE